MHYNNEEVDFKWLAAMGQYGLQKPKLFFHKLVVIFAWRKARIYTFGLKYSNADKIGEFFFSILESFLFSDTLICESIVLPRNFFLI